MIAAEILGQQNYFRCEKMACTLPRQTCLKRQEQAMSFREYTSGRDAAKKKLAYAMCADCKQGKTLKKEMAA